MTLPYLLFAVTTPPGGVLPSDGSEVASMALIALALAAASIVARRLPDSGAGRDPRAPGGAGQPAASTRARW